MDSKRSTGGFAALRDGSSSVMLIPDAFRLHFSMSKVTRVRRQWMTCYSLKFFPRMKHMIPTFLVHLDVFLSRCLKIRNPALLLPAIDSLQRFHFEFQAPLQKGY